MAAVASRKVSRARPDARQAPPAAGENDGKALVSVDPAEINHAPLPARAPAGHPAVTGLLKAKIETLQARKGRGDGDWSPGRLRARARPGRQADGRRRQADGRAPEDDRRNA